jgi:predicted DCC family thiol-disulfide oxidoreductase YuxK
MNFCFASLQGPTARSLLKQLGRNPEDLDTFYVLADYKSTMPRLYDRSRAGLFVLQRLNTPWRVLRFAGILPTVVLDVFYRLLARNRYRIFGRFDQCQIPSPEHAGRFIEDRQ